MAYLFSLLAFIILTSTHASSEVHLKFLGF